MTSQPSSEPASQFTEREAQIVNVAHMVENGKTYWVAGGGSPLYAIILAKRSAAPQAQYITEDGCIAPEPDLPLDPIMTMVAAKAGYRALQWGNMNASGMHAQVGLMDYGILNTLQVDRWGNVNSTATGDYEGEGRRFNGPGGADSIAALCWRTILMTDQQKRKFVDHVDFVSSPGFLDGSEGARERAGLPRNTGPYKVVTPWAVFGYDSNRHLRLEEVAPWVTKEQVLAEMSFEPTLAPEIGVMEIPTEDELNTLRTELDVRGQTSDVGAWIIRNDDRSWTIAAP
ncbi:MAG: CoA-transferase [Dehalococcoidia bacterium]